MANSAITIHPGMTKGTRDNETKPIAVKTAARGIPSASAGQSRQPSQSKAMPTSASSGAP